MDKITMEITKEELSVVAIALAEFMNKYNGGTMLTMHAKKTLQDFGLRALNRMCKENGIEEGFVIGGNN